MLGGLNVSVEVKKVKKSRVDFYQKNNGKREAGYCYMFCLCNERSLEGRWSNIC